jgi:hypothetical protein
MAMRVLTALSPFGVFAIIVYMPDATRRPARLHPFHVKVPPVDVPLQMS